MNDFDCNLYYIAHHQVKGAHWGIMNGPPYPLGSDVSTGNRLKSAAKGVGKYVSDKVKRIKYGKSYDSSVVGNINTSFGKTKYTNLDGTLNEKGKSLASRFAKDEIEKNNKYYDKKIDKYKKAIEAYKDEPKVAKQFESMVKSAEESRNRTNDNLKNLPLEQILKIQLQRNTQKAKIAAGVASVAGIGGLATAITANPQIGQKASDLFYSIDADTPMRAVNAVYNTKFGHQCMNLVDTGIRSYADVHAYVMGTAIDQSINRMNSMGIPEKIGKSIGDAGNAAAKGMDQTGVSANYAKMGAAFVNTFLNETNGSMSNTANEFATSANIVSNATNAKSNRVTQNLQSNANVINSTTINPITVNPIMINKALSMPIR